AHGYSGGSYPAARPVCSRCPGRQILSRTTNNWVYHCGTIPTRFGHYPCAVGRAGADLGNQIVNPGGPSGERMAVFLPPGISKEFQNVVANCLSQGPITG